MTGWYKAKLDDILVKNKIRWHPSKDLLHDILVMSKIRWDPSKDRLRDILVKSYYMTS